MRIKEIIEDTQQDVTELEYKGNIGIQEVMRFYMVATPEQKARLQKYIAQQQNKDAWALVNKVTGTKLTGKEFATEDIAKLIAEGPFAEVDQDKQPDYSALWTDAVPMPTPHPGIPRPTAPKDLNVPKDRYKVIGSGMEAVVIKEPEDPSVIKIVGGRNEIQNNGLMQYLLLSRKYAEVNPYFPKILSIKKVSVPEYATTVKFMLAIQMEELLPLKKLTKAQLAEIINQIVVGKNLQAASVYMLEEVMIASADIRSGKSALRIKDPNFAAVTKLIRLIQHKTGATFDLHYENMMARMVGGVPQLVITDPVN